MNPLRPVPLPHDAPSDIGLWRVDVDFGVSLDAVSFHSISDDERSRARRFRRPEDALRFATVRAALRETLAAHLNVTAAGIRFALDSNRRPHLAGPARVDFNVSHAGTHGLIAISAARRVGVDIEQCREPFDWRSIAALTLDPDEASCIGRLDPTRRVAAFYDAWVAKEALVKTTGVGIPRGLHHLTVLPRESESVTLRKHVPDDMRDVAAQWIMAPAGYAACVAWSTEAFERDPH
ncbi:4'-phosphopantetheinyl transferase superfamily protein [Paraburkholderia sp. PREW-6R]|uniref:4'-phosphopantetheinyl transferase family protein n=1 Tax=Paraburkholderia sp. PREW-6R TaxID=3141544 RepID=UPI0031F4C9FC